MTSFASRRGVLAGALSLLPLRVGAQPTLPDRALRILVGFAAGGGADLVARTIAPALQGRAGRTVSVENRPGASGALMGAALKKAAPDGSTVGLIPSTTLIGQLTSPATFPFDTLADLAALGIVGTFDTVFCVSPRTGVTTMAEYAKWVKDGPPERRRFGTSAPDTFSQYFAQLLGRQYDVTLEPVAYRGAGPLVADLDQGRISAGCGAMAAFAHHHRGNRVRMLATSGGQRNAAARDVPTVVELGHRDLQLVDWYGFFAPAGLPPKLIAVWNRDLSAAVETPEVTEQLTQLGVTVGTTKPDECAVRLASDLVRWKALLDMLGIGKTN